jgi:hypothetical protein
MNATNEQCFQPGAPWHDTDGKLIQAHSGGMLFHQGMYYWYGEDKDGPTLYDEGLIVGYRVPVIGIRCYSSKDLYHWKNEGLVLPAVADSTDHDLHPTRIAERPKVLYNAKTGTFVMWLHIDTANYESARAGLAIADSPCGPFSYLGSHKPNGHDCRDMTLFQDDDGSAWLIHSAEWNKTLVFSELTPDYLGFTGVHHRQFAGRNREAPVLFKHERQYFLVSSGCTGWDPNEAEYAVADAITGPWRVVGNPCRGPDAHNTFHAQSSFCIPLKGSDYHFVMAFDRHVKEDLGNSRYVWLPVKIVHGSLDIQWFDTWSW